MTTDLEATYHIPLLRVQAFWIFRTRLKKVALSTVTAVDEGLAPASPLSAVDIPWRTDGGECKGVLSSGSGLRWANAQEP